MEIPSRFRVSPLAMGKGASESLAKALVITRREAHDSLRDWRIVTPILLLTLIFPWIMSLASKVAANFAVAYGVADNAAIITQQLVPFSLLIVGFFPISFSLVIALETFVGERERNTLEPLLATPISDGELYLGKLLAAMLLPVAASYLGLVFHLIGLRWITNYHISAQAFLQVALLTTMEALVMVAGAVVVSSHTTSVRAANLLASFIIVPIALFLQGEAVLLFWMRYDVIWLMILGLLIVDLALVRTGIRIFNREGILARQYDEVTRSGLRRSFSRFWSSPPGIGEEPPPLTLGRLYRSHLPRLLRHYLSPLSVVLVVMAGGLLMGWAFAMRYPLRGGLEGLVNSDLGREWQDLGVMPGLNVWGIFIHNVRALLIAAFLGVISFGVASLLLLLVPLGMVGFLLGQAVSVGYSPFIILVAFVLPHGLVEIPAAWIATAFALKIGAAILAPPRGLSLGEGFLLAIINFLKIFFLLVVPLLLLAAFLEARVTPRVALWLLGG